MAYSNVHFTYVQQVHTAHCKHERECVYTFICTNTYTYVASIKARIPTPSVLYVKLLKMFTLASFFQLTT